MISIQQMQYLMVLSEQRQFQKASELCFVTQPTLSMQVKKAEEELGYPVFDRSHNPLELTDFGKQLIPVIRDVLNETEKIDVLAKKMAGNYKEQLYVGIIPTVAAYMVPDLFSVWKEKIGGINLKIVELKTEELLEAMERKEIDLAIMAGPENQSRLRILPLYKEEIFVYVPHLDGETIWTDDLHSLHPWLLSKGNCLRTQMISFCQLKEEQESESWNYEGGNLELLLNMVDSYGGYSLVPEFYHISNRQKKALKRVQTPVSKAIPAREIIALTPNKTYKWELIQAFIREIQFKYNKPHAELLPMEILNWKGVN